jgi:hypothetical protein
LERLPCRCPSGLFAPPLPRYCRRRTLPHLCLHQRPCSSRRRHQIPDRRCVGFRRCSHDFSVLIEIGSRPGYECCLDFLASGWSSLCLTGHLHLGCAGQCLHGPGILSWIGYHQDCGRDRCSHDSPASDQSSLHQKSIGGGSGLIRVLALGPGERSSYLRVPFPLLLCSALPRVRSWGTSDRCLPRRPDR